MGLYCQSDSLKLKTAGTYPSPLDLQSSSSANLPSTQLLCTSFILRLFFTTVQSNYNARLFFTTVQSNYDARLFFTTVQSNYNARLFFTTVQSNYDARLFFTTVQSNYDAYKEYVSYTRSSKTLRLVFIVMATPGAGARASCSPSLRSR